MDFDCSTTEDGKTVINLRGEMDTEGCTIIRPKLEEEIGTDTCSNLVFDLNQVSFLDSSGIGLIVFMFKRLKAQGCSLEIQGAQDQPLELIKLLRIDKVIPVTI